MAGIIEQAQEGNLSPDNIRAQMHVPKNLEGAYNKIILAGMKVMFDKSTHEMMLKEINGPGTMAQRLGKGITGLMAVLWQQSNKTMPPNLMIPAGIELMAHAVDYVKKSGQEVSNEEFGEAVQIFVQNTLQAFGLDPEKVAMIGARGAEGMSGEGPAPEAPMMDEAAGAGVPAAPDETQPQGV